ncbi:MAG: T9SS type A sorting domain-containing protein [Bacteroidales bacterium]|nr:T9SS type A sorting domain-containing protein [Bacteroidales bacterium]
MKKNRLLLFTFIVTGLFSVVYGQEDTIRSLIFTEFSASTRTEAYMELSNMGSDTLDLSRFCVAWVNGKGTQLDYTDGIWSVVDDINLGNKSRLWGTLAPGDSYLIMNALYDYAEIDTMPDEVSFRKDLYYLADLVCHDDDPWRSLLYQWGQHAQVLYYRLDSGDSILVDQVKLSLDENLQMLPIYDDVAGILEASGAHTLVRKANITQGNMDWEKSKGTTIEDSEWLPIPHEQGRKSYTTAGVHGDYSIDVSSSIVAVDNANSTITVPWGISKGDSLINRLDIGPGMAWQYLEKLNVVDSTHVIMRNGDTLRLYAAGNDLEVQDFAITVLDPELDEVNVYPLLRKVPPGLQYYDPFSMQISISEDTLWIQPYDVTVNQPGMDTITNIPYATRVDSLYKYLEKAPKATWDIVWYDDEEQADVREGDILRLTSEDLSVTKDYYLAVEEYASSDNVNLGAITWPDKDEDLDGWKGDTIPQFSSSKSAYTVMVLYGDVNVPALVAIPQDINATVNVERAVSLTGSLEDRSTVFTVTSESDTTEKAYTVIFEIEKDPANVHDYEGMPFFSEFATNQRSQMGYLEICNPGTVNMDLSEYMIVRSTHINKGDAMDALVADQSDPIKDFKDRYQAYVPGYKFHEDSANWIIEPGILSIDLAVNSVIGPGEVFVLSVAPRGREQFYTESQLEIIDKKWTGPQFMDEELTIDLINVVPYLVREANALYLFKITNDSILEGTKAIGDPNDVDLVDVIGDANANGIWPIAGTGIGNNTRGRYRTKPNIYTGAPSIAESAERFGTHPDTSDWIVEIYGTDFEVFDDLPLYIGSHNMDPVTVYLSTLTSPIYLVSDGYATEQTIQGDLSETSADDFYANISPADTSQVLSLHSSVDGSVKTGADPVAENDTLIVTSADGRTTTKYVLINLSLSSNAVLETVNTTSYLTVDADNGIISGMEYGAVLKEILDSLFVPEFAVMNVIDGAGNLIPNQLINYDSTKSDVRVGDDVYLEVIAQDQVTIIVYKMEPAVLSSDAFVISSIYNIDQDYLLISGLADATVVELFFANIEAVKGATLSLVTKLGHERLDGKVSYDDRLVVVSEDGNTTVSYYLTFLHELNADLPNMPPSLSISAASEVIAQTTITFTGEASDPNGSELTYWWDVETGNKDDVVFAAQDQLITDVTFNVAGSYVLSLTVSDGEFESTETHSINVTPNVGYEMYDVSGIAVYPNPVRHMLTIEMNAENSNASTISLFSITGSKILEKQISSRISEIDVSVYDAGLYILKIDTGEDTLVQRVEIMK